MPSQQPTMVTMNDVHVKVQQWRHNGDRISLTTLLRGTTAADDLLKQIQQDHLTVAWDDVEPVLARVERLNHQTAGEGAKTVHRIELTLMLEERESEPGERSIESRLDLILAELRALRLEVAELRGAKRSSANTLTAPLAAGRTMLDFDLATEDSKKHPIE